VRGVLDGVGAAFVKPDERLPTPGGSMSPTPLKNTHWLASLVAASVLTAAATAHAEDDLIAPGTRPMWAALALGPAIGIKPSGVTQFKLEQEFGYHFQGDSSGPAVGFNIGESFGDGLTVIQPGGKFWWDIAILEDKAIYLSPSAKLGYGGFFGGGSFHTFNWQLAVEGKVVLADRAVLYFRPFALDFFAGSEFVVRYDIMFGGGVTF
jgi:hypothetical protein